MSSFNSSESLEDIDTCYVTITSTNSDTGESSTETYYSTSRTSDSDCAAGRDALLSENFMMSADFKRSPVLAP
ncbi:hypothetical protein [Gillisia hiemivivida]|uniref:Uncharacterized protein n=1 Tax=Gillisia hiemivivida TaxID=291190 RepID=A0A5C6ZXT5_9FLAO|nr:hypothetical protein [Gillisia hiemivivida]TXD94901.1 hypothetical protein ES724_05375 [Gillisia hiemivivida]